MSKRLISQVNKVIALIAARGTVGLDAEVAVLERVAKSGTLDDLTGVEYNCVINLIEWMEEANGAHQGDKVSV